MLLDRSILPKDQPQDEEDDEEEKGFSIKKMCQKLCGLLFCYVSEGSLAMKDFGSSLISSLLFLFHFTQLTVRFTAITWFLGTFGVIGLIVILILLLVRGVA